MPRLAVGTMTFGTTVPRAVAHRILDTAVERGATFLDTAAQQRFSYLRPQPGADFFPHVFVDDDLDALCAREGVALLGYAALLGGAYSRADKDLPDGYATPETPRMLAALAHASQVSGLDAGQTVLSWMAHRRSPVIPVVGVSSREQLLSAIHAVETRLDDDTMKHMSQARGDAG